MLVGNKTDLISDPFVLRKLSQRHESVVTLKDVFFVLFGSHILVRSYGRGDRCISYCAV